MEQQPVAGSAPLPAPSADTAAAYLAELERVRERREERIDRRALSLSSMIGAVVLSVYVGMACFSIGVGSANSSFLVVLALFLLWVQLITEFRESHGVLGSPFAQRHTAGIVIVIVLVVVIVAGIAVSAFDIDVPVPVRLIPPVLALLVMGVPALREFYRSNPRESAIRQRPLTRLERLSTIGIAVIVSASIWVLGAGDFLVVSIFAFVVLVGFFAWWIAGRISERLPALGAVWAWPQWSAFALAGAAITAVMAGHLLGFTGPVSALAPIAAVVVFVLFSGSAFLDGRDA